MMREKLSNNSKYNLLIFRALLLIKVGGKGENIMNDRIIFQQHPPFFFLLCL